MGTTTIPELVPELFTSYDKLDPLDLNLFFKSGVAGKDPRMRTLMDATEGGIIVNMPYWNTLSDTEENIGNDVSSAKAVTEGITAGYETAVKSFVNKGYSSMEIAGILAGSDPMAAINSEIDTMWTGRWQSRLLATTQGIIADSVANHSSDLIYDISTASGTASTIDGTAVVYARAKMGDRMRQLKVIAMHSMVYANLQTKELITYIRDSDNNTMFEIFNGMQVIVDDAMPVDTRGEAPVYDTYLFGSNVFTVELGYPGRATEIDRDTKAGMGQGEDILFTRRCFLVHPRGYRVNVNALTNKTGATLTELATAATWTRAITERKRIPFVAIKSLG